MEINKNKYFINRINLKNLQGYIVYIGFILIVIILSILLRNEGFLSIENMMNILRQTTMISVMAMGMTFAISCGEIDLSIGATVALASLVSGILLRAQYPVIIAVLGGLGVGLVIGLVNGLITTKARVPAILVTLGVQSIVYGTARIITDLRSVPIINKNFNFYFGSGTIGLIPILLIWTIVMAVFSHLLLKKTPFGRKVLATGGNISTAYFTGVNTDFIRIAALTMSSLYAALAGLLYAGRLHSGRYTLGEADLLTVIAAVVIGGTSLAGGAGSITGAIIGSLLMGVLNNGLLIMGLNVSQQFVVRGIIIVIAISISLREKREM